jgi:ribonuclease D
MSTQQDNQPEIEYIDSRAGLENACRRLSHQDCLAVDTEFVREKTYYPVLCLIQIASPQYCVCIDPLAITDLSPLTELLLVSRTTKVFHAARQDLEILYQTLNAMPAPIFDTQIAAALLGLGDQLSYANLVKHFLKVQLAKGHARTNWEQRPLSDEQITYAADDVRYLIQLYPLMVRALTELGRLDWLDEDFQSLTAPALYQTDATQQWHRVSGLQKLKGVQLAILQRLASWREQQAQQQNKPRKWILSDDILIALAQQAPQKVAQLERIRGIHPGMLQRHGQTLLGLIAEAKTLPRTEWPVLARRIQLDANQEAMLDALMSIVKLQATAHQIHPSVLSTRHDLEKLVSGENNVPLLHGWRLGIAGQAVKTFIGGHSKLVVTQQRLTIESVP